MAACEKISNHHIQPQHFLLGPICSAKNQLTSQPFSQQPLKQGRKARHHHAVKCAAAVSKDAAKQSMPQIESEWAHSMGIESSGLRVAEFAGDLLQPSLESCGCAIPLKLSSCLSITDLL